MSNSRRSSSSQSRSAVTDQSLASGTSRWWAANWFRSLQRTEPPNKHAAQSRVRPSTRRRPGRPRHTEFRGRQHCRGRKPVRTLTQPEVAPRRRQSRTNACVFVVAMRSRERTKTICRELAASSTQTTADRRRTATNLGYSDTRPDRSINVSLPRNLHVNTYRPHLAFAGHTYP